MFVEAELRIPLPLEAARTALARALNDGGLIIESRRAVDEGLAFLMPVGPRGAQNPAREVLVTLLPSRQVGCTTVVPLRWEATGPTGRLFPALDANLSLTAADADSVILSIIGRYEPPFGPLGTIIDRTLLPRVASATIKSLLREIAAHLRALVNRSET